MSRMVQCTKLGKELPGLAHPPMKGDLGRRIFETVSAEAWKQWVTHSTMVINEFRLNPSEPKAQEVLQKQMEAFLFGEGAAPPPDFVPQG